MSRVVKINFPEQVERAVREDFDIIRFGEQYCVLRANEVWPAEKMTAVIECLRANGKKGELCWPTSPTSIEEEKRIAQLVKIVEANQDVAQPLINDWGHLHKYQALAPVAGSRLMVYNSLSLELLVEQEVKEFYLPVDLNEAETDELIEKARELNLRPALNNLPAVLLVSWTCLYREAESQYSKACMTNCHPHPPTMMSNEKELFRLDGRIVKAAAPPETNIREEYSRVLEINFH